MHGFALSGLWRLCARVGCLRLNRVWPVLNFVCCKLSIKHGFGLHFLRRLDRRLRHTCDHFAPFGFVIAKTAAKRSMSLAMRTATIMPLHDIAIVGAFIVVFALLLAVGRYMGSYGKKRRQYHD